MPAAAPTGTDRRRASRTSAGVPCATAAAASAVEVTNTAPPLGGGTNARSATRKSAELSDGPLLAACIFMQRHRVDAEAGEQ